MKRRLGIMLLLIAALIPGAVAQIVTSQSPYGLGVGGTVRSMVELPVTRLGAFDRDSALLAMERQNESDLRVLTFAHKQVTDVDIPATALHTQRGDTDIWQMRVTSRGAESLNFFFSHFYLPAGARLYIYSTRDSGVVIGPFGAENNNERRVLSTIPIPSDDVILELQVPTGEPAELRLGEVNHALLKLQDKYDPNSYDCAPEVACYPATADIARSVVLMYIDGVTMGTGWLTNTAKNDGRPYILTASHVLTGNFKYQNNEERAAKTLVVFNYAANICGKGTQPALTQSLSGAKMIGIDTKTDACMLEMNQRPPSSYRPYYAGWRATNTPEGPYHNIHHPYYQTKRVNRALTVAADLSEYGSTFPWGTTRVFIKVLKWEIGTTAEGSSGSPLFDKNGQAVGGLTGGYSYCTQRASDYFFSLAEVFKAEREGAQSIRRHLTGGDLSLTSYGGREEDGAKTPKSLRISHMPPLSGAKEIREQLTPIDPIELKRYAEVAERYDVSGGSKISGVYLMVDVAPTTQFAPSSEPLVLRVYDALSPDRGELVSAVVPQDLLKATPQAPLIREVYIPLASPLPVSAKMGSYYFTLNPGGLPANATIVSHMGERATAFVKESGAFRPLKGSLWLDLMVDRDDYVPLEGREPFVDLRAGSGDELILTFAKRLEGKGGELKVYTLLGQPVYSTGVRDRVLVLDRRPLEGLGVLVFRMEVGGEKESLKIILPRRDKQ